MRRGTPVRAAAAALLLALLPGLPGAAQAVDRIPRPDFTAGYQAPDVQAPAPRSPFLEYADVAILVLALSAAAWLGLRARNRGGLFLLGVFSLAYFGFYRKGCICPVGSIQNVALALADPGYALPLTAVLFFALPLVSALLSGRSFCAAVCPLGAVQDAVVLKPLRVPRWLAAPLEFLPVVYLGLAVLFAATGAEFVVCRFDPFVSFFRMNGSLEMLGLGACFLALGTVVARPYCRFLCPYGVLLGWLSRLSVLHVTVTPDECVQCRLCAEACPVDAIRPPSPLPASKPSAAERRAFAAGLIALPLLVALGAVAGGSISPLLARVHPEVRLADRVAREDAGMAAGTTLESEAFRASRRTREDLVASAGAVLKRFDMSGPVLGGSLALVLALTVLAGFRPGKREGYVPDRGACVGCGRCFSYCPREHLRRAERAQS